MFGTLQSVDRRAAHCRLALREEQPLQLCAGMFGTHERFAYQERVDIVDFHQLDVGPVENAAFGDHRAITRNARQQVQRGFQADLEGMQVAVVDADQLGVEGFQRALQLVTSCTSTSTSRPTPLATAASSAICTSSSAETISRMQSAPSARASTT